MTRVSEPLLPWINWDLLTQTLRVLELVMAPTVVVFVRKAPGQLKPEMSTSEVRMGMM
jgi:hypothetical protein